jgi:hypothetical protein
MADQKNLGVVRSSQLPEKYLVREIKQCENCPRNFVRTRHTGLRYCGVCMSSHLEPYQTLEEKEREILKLNRGESIPRHSLASRHYDGTRRVSALSVTHGIGSPRSLAKSTSL